MCHSYNLIEYFTGKCMADHDGEMFKSGESPNRLHYRYFSLKRQLNESINLTIKIMKSIYKK